MYSGKKYQYGVCCIRLEILYKILKKKSHLNLFMQSYELLKFELQKCMNSKAKGEKQKIGFNCMVWIIGPNTC